MIQHVCLCERGCRRTINQDRAGGWTDGDTGLFFVADGIGGHFAGEKASGILAEELAAWWGSGRHMPSAQAAEQLQQLIDRGDARIRQQTPPGQRCGSTLVILWITGGTYALLSVGDSRCYQTRRRMFGAETMQLTTDDVLPDTAGPDRGKLSRAVGAGRCLVSVRCGELTSGTLFTLCSDGIYKYCDSAGLHNSLAKARRTALLRQAAGEIESRVLDRQAPDNYSLVLVRPVL